MKTIYYSPATGILMTNDSLWKLFQPVKYRYTFQQFREALGYEPINDYNEILKRINDQTMLNHLILRRLKALSIVNETLRLAIEKISKKSDDSLYEAVIAFLSPREKPVPKSPLLIDWQTFSLYLICWSSGISLLLFALRIMIPDSVLAWLGVLSVLTITGFAVSLKRGDRR